MISKSLYFFLFDVDLFNKLLAVCKRKALKQESETVSMGCNYVKGWDEGKTTWIFSV